MEQTEYTYGNCGDEAATFFVLGFLRVLFWSHGVEEAKINTKDLIDSNCELDS
jgi:hypothetical protein